MNPEVPKYVDAIKAAVNPRVFRRMASDANKGLMAWGKTPSDWGPQVDGRLKPGG